MATNIQIILQTELPCKALDTSVFGIESTREFMHSITYTNQSEWRIHKSVRVGDAHLLNVCNFCNPIFQSELAYTWYQKGGGCILLL